MTRLSFRDPDLQIELDAMRSTPQPSISSFSTPTPRVPPSRVNFARTSSTSAASVVPRRPKYLFWLMLGWLCPSWSATARADFPASSMSEATVLRKTWLVTHP